MDASDLLADQLEVTVRTWVMLREHGVAEGEERAVDFFFNAPDEDHAQTLAGALGSLGASAQVRSDRVGSLRKRTVWSVRGTSVPLMMSESSLCAWVSEMVQLGSVHESLFDGWGATA